MQRDILQRSRQRVRNGVILVTAATAAFGSDGMKVVATNAPMFAHATAASHFERLRAPLPEPDTKLIDSLLIPYQSRDAVLRMNGRFAPLAAISRRSLERLVPISATSGR